MPFLNDIAAALERETDEVQAYVGSMVVEDSLNELGLRTVLLLESPHRDETSARHPLAGSAGRNVTEAFAKYHPNNFYHDANFGGPHEPIGCLLRRLQGLNTDEQLSEGALNTLNSLGLMNVSRLPLQSRAYCLDARTSYSDLLGHFEAIRKAMGVRTVAAGVAYLRNLDDGHPARVYRALRDDLITRLPEDENVEVIPCGKIARAFYCWAISCGDAEDHGILDDFVPHPSYGWWTTRPHYGDRICTLVEQAHERAATVQGDD